MLIKILEVVGLMFAGGLITSYVEYRLSYNLYDLIKDKLTGGK